MPGFPRVNRSGPVTSGGANIILRPAYLLGASKLGWWMPNKCWEVWPCSNNYFVHNDDFVHKLGIRKN